MKDQIHFKKSDSGITSSELIPVIKKLKTIIKNQFNCNFDFILAADIDPILSQKLKNNVKVNKQNRIYFPIILSGHLHGAARIQYTESLPKKEINKMNDVITLVLRSSFLSLNRLETLNQLEGQLRTLNTPSNLIRLEDFRSSRVPTVSDSAPQKAPSTRFNISVLIESKIESDIFKMALEIHNFSRRYAFISIKDLKPDALKSSESINALGNLTLFIPNVLDLTQTERDTLTHFLNGARQKDSPQIIAGTTTPYKELIDSADIDNYLVRRFAVAYLKMNKPFKNYLKQDLVSFFYGSLSGQHLEDLI